MNNAYAPNTDDMIATCAELCNEDDRLEYLSECFSYDYSCPDKCDAMAVEFYNEYEDDIETCIAENAHEAFISDFHGGGGVESLKSQMEKARKLK